MRGPARYPLEVPLGLRTLAEDAARAALGDARAREDAREGERAACAARVAETLEIRRGEERALAAGAGATAEALLARARYAFRLRGEEARHAAALRAAEGTLAEARAEAEGRRLALANARAERRALERHREGWAATLRQERRRREQDETDDLVSGRRAGR